MLSCLLGLAGRQVALSCRLQGLWRPIRGRLGRELHVCGLQAWRRSACCCSGSWRKTLWRQYVSNNRLQAPAAAGHVRAQYQAQTVGLHWGSNAGMRAGKARAALEMQCDLLSPASAGWLTQAHLVEATGAEGCTQFALGWAELLQGRPAAHTSTSQQIVELLTWQR